MKHASAQQRPTPAATKLVICVWHPFTLWRPPAEFASELRRRWPEMTVIHLQNYDLLAQELPHTDIFVGYSIRQKQFVFARKLKWIHSTASGIAQLTYPELRSSGIVVTNASGVHKIPMAEHTLGALIALARRFPDCFRAQSKKHWAQQEIWDAKVRPREMHGSVLLFVGFGAIGQEVAKRAKPLGMKIWAITRSGGGNSELAERILPANELESVLPEADFVVLAAPETPGTHHLIGARQLALMKPTAYLVNVARGSLVNEAALVDALKRHVIAGAALDVADAEPLPPRSPLWKLDNLFLTPHVSSASEHLWERQTALVVENLERWFSGRELLNQVDLNRGY
jgi:phosphoglycerate dehydrogenase-like enzyme